MSDSGSANPITITIATHSGVFHCDEVMATAMLRLLDGSLKWSKAFAQLETSNPALFSRDGATTGVVGGTAPYRDDLGTLDLSKARIVRTRTPSELAKADIVVDVGGVYDPATNRFDHHQREFYETFDKNHTTKLSSAGLVYKHYGLAVVATVLRANQDRFVTVVESPTAVPTVTADQILTTWRQLYDAMIEEIDAIDNGISACEIVGKPKYERSSNIASRIGRLNPEWNELGTTPDERFLQAVEVATAEFVSRCCYCGLSVYPSQILVRAAVADRITISDGAGNDHHIIDLGRYCPWKEHLADLESKLPDGGASNKFIVFQDPAGDWRVSTIPRSLDAFKFRLGLLKAWRGKSGEELSELVGADANFVHASGFIGGANQKETAIMMAKLSILGSAAAAAE